MGKLPIEPPKEGPPPVMTKQTSERELHGVAAIMEPWIQLGLRVGIPSGLAVYLIYWLTQTVAPPMIQGHLEYLRQSTQVQEQLVQELKEISNALDLDEKEEEQVFAWMRSVDERLESIKTNQTELRTTFNKITREP